MPRKRKSNLSQHSNSARAMKVARFNETFPQAGLQRLEQAELDAAHRAAETPESSQARRLQHATYMASQRDTETIEAAESRKRAVAERAQQRRLIFTKNTWGVFNKAAFEYDETLDYESHKLIKIKAMNKECRFCGALQWKEESEVIQQPMRPRAYCAHHSLRDHWTLWVISKCPDQVVSLKRDVQCLSHQESLVVIY
ncbi:uncharacterized protein TNCV_3086991 [Trichonephila clavipes]|nr:uncharacterized protein TNCV_3086991 [Trichonephila clavipes]